MDVLGLDWKDDVRNFSLWLHPVTLVAKLKQKALGKDIISNSVLGVVGAPTDIVTGVGEAVVGNALTKGKMIYENPYLLLAPSGVSDAKIAFGISQQHMQSSPKIIASYKVKKRHQL